MAELPSTCPAQLCFLREVICDSDDDRFAYLLNWLACAVQGSKKTASSAIALFGPHSSGKTTFLELCTGLLDPADTARIYVPRQLAALAKRGFLKKTRGVLLIDEGHWAVEKVVRYAEGGNNARIVLTTTVPATFERLATFALSVTRRNDFAFWQAYREEVKNSAGALLQVLRGRDVRDYDPTVLPPDGLRKIL